MELNLEGAYKMNESNPVRLLINAAQQRLVVYAIAKKSAKQEIETLQKACLHEWRFVNQYNSLHADLWDVKKQCTHCDLINIDKKVPPICSTCGEKLFRAREDDREALVERVKPEHQGRYNPPEAWRCSACNKIHILYVEGD